jgi:signal transduction histidine kinase
LEKQLINYITDIGKASVKTIKPNMLQIFPGFTETKTFHKLKKDLRKYQTDFNIDNIILMTPEKRVVVDLSGMFKNGDEYLFIDINKRQLVSLQGGHIKSSSLYKNMNNRYCENIYFPIFDKNKDFKGVMILFASAKYFHSLMNFQKKLSYLFVVIIILSGLLLYLLAHSISKPVVQLSKLVDKIGEGELNAAVPYKSRKDEIGRLAKNIKDMMDKIKSKNIFMRRVSAGIAHEIRNPLTAIKGNLMLIKRAINTDPRLLEMVNDNLREVNSLENLVSDFMNYAKSINIELKSVKANDVI